MKNFADRLADAIEAKNSRVVVGIDPRLGRLPPALRERAAAGGGDPLERAAEVVAEFARGIIDAVAHAAAAVKPQAAFYELFAAAGWRALADTAAYARERGLLVIGDVKRGDIGSTAEAYAQALLGETRVGDAQIASLAFDAVTVNPYLGSDGVRPFIDAAAARGKGVFVLVKTSNRSSRELQDLPVGDALVFERLADLVSEWGAGLIGERGYSAVGAVVGATHPDALAALRRRMPHTPFLIPGYGAQGGGAADAAPGFDDRGLGAVVNSSRGIIFAYERGGDDDWRAAAAAAAERMRDDINRAIGVGS